MSIEFACESCTKLLRVPDGTEGSSCQCPACGVLLKIPDPNAIKMVEVDEEAETEDQLKIACPKCRFPLVCDPSLLGTKGQCRNCKYIFLISTSPDGLGSANGASGWVFSCPHCDQLFEGQEEMRGRKGKCHACGEVFSIELREAESPEFAYPEISKVPEKAPVGSPAQGHAAIPAAIQLACSSCAGVMEVPSSAVGQTTACPFCQQLLQIPDPRGSAAVPSPAPRPRQAPQAPQAQAASASQNARPSSSPGAMAIPQTPQPEQDIWADLGDQSGQLHPAANPYTPAASSTSWDAPLSQRRRGLTFSGAFGLTFELAFPTCLVAVVIYLMLGVANAIIVYGGGFLLRIFLQSAQLERTTAITIAGVFLFIVSIVAICLSTVGVCMTCNGALATVRRKRPGSDVLFSTGDVFLPMLAFLFFMTLLYGAIAFLPQGVVMLVGPNPVLILLSALLVLGLLVLLGATQCLAPFAIIDGEGPFSAMGTSLGIFASKPLDMLGIFLAGTLLYLGIGLVTCGLGALLLVGFPFYLFASAYHLATK